MQDVNYSVPVPPDTYQCGGCGATGVKLWREYQSSRNDLLCAHCAAADQRVNIASLDSSGAITKEDGVKTDHIGDFVPAIPHDIVEGYWGYTSAPAEAARWWGRLPSTVMARVAK